MADGRNSSRTIWYIVAAVIVVLLLGWLLGLFGADEAGEVETDAAVVTEEGVATGEAAEEAVEDAAEDAEDAVD